METGLFVTIVCFLTLAIGIYWKNKDDLPSLTSVVKKPEALSNANEESDNKKTENRLKFKEGEVWITDFIDEASFSIMKDPLSAEAGFFCTCTKHDMHTILDYMKSRLFKTPHSVKMDTIGYDRNPDAVDAHEIYETFLLRSFNKVSEKIMSNYGDAEIHVANRHRILVNHLIPLMKVADSLSVCKYNPALAVEVFNKLKVEGVIRKIKEDMKSLDDEEVVIRNDFFTTQAPALSILESSSPKVGYIPSHDVQKVISRAGDIHSRVERVKSLDKEGRFHHETSDIRASLDTIVESYNSLTKASEDKFVSLGTRMLNSIEKKRLGAIEERVSHQGLAVLEGRVEIEEM